MNIRAVYTSQKPYSIKEKSAFNWDFFLVYKSTSSLEPADQYLFYSFALGAL